MLSIKVLGPGCAKCNKLYDEAQKAIKESGVEAELTKVENLDEIVDYGVMLTPALVINKEVKTVGKVPRAAAMAKWFIDAATK